MFEFIDCVCNSRFSGDTRPCAALEMLGQAAELVIHEANFEDSMIELAQLKKHSTTR
jgi:ribonuclease BN (tRNA processing enzyme)